MVDPKLLRAHLEELIEDAEVTTRDTTEHEEYVQAAKDEFESAGFDLAVVPPRAIAIRAHELLAVRQDEVIDELDKDGRLGV